MDQQHDAPHIDPHTGIATTGHEWDGIRELAGLSTEPKVDLALGRKLFADNCASCHGEAGKGNPEMGAPNLTDAISLYGMDVVSLTETIANSRNGVMPAWGGRLDATTIKALTVYVHSLGGGQ